MAVTRINNNQISDASSGNAAAGINAATKVQDYSITAGKLANNITYGSDLTVSGNLTVQGNTTQINTDIVTVEDPLLVLASNQTGAPALDIGFIGERGTGENIAFVWEESANAFVTAFTTTAESNTTITVTSFADFKTHNANVTNNLEVVGTTSLVGNIISNANVTGNINSANVFTVGQVSATGDVTGGNIVTLGNVDGANVNATATVFAGNVSATGNVNSANLNVGPVSILNAGNITGVTTLTANANVTTTGNVSGNAIYSDHYFTANGSPATQIAGGSNTQVQFNEGPNNSFGASAAFTFNYAAGANLLTAGNITSAGALSAVGTATVGNVDTAGNVSATGLVTGGNFSTAGNVVATGNVIATGYANAAAVTVSSLSNTQVVFANAVSGLTNDSALTYDYAAGVQLLTTANLSVVGSSTTAHATVTDIANTQIVFGNTTSGLVGNSTLTFDSTNGNLNAPIVYASGNVTGNALNAIGDLKVGGIGNINSLVVPTTANIVGNIDGSTINLSGIANVVGNLNAGNVSTANVGASNVNGTNIYTANITSANTITLTSGNAITISANVGNANVSFSGSVLNQVGTPVAQTDGANKEYVDSIASGLDLKASCELATTIPLDTVTNVTNVAYNNGTAGVGATITITSTAQISIDGVDLSTLTTPTARILIKNELVSPTATSDAAWNGIYTLTSNSGTAVVLTRSTDTDDEGTTGQLPGAFTFIHEGTINLDTGWVCSTNNPIVMGTTPIIWTQFSAAGTYTAGSGLILSGTQFSVAVDNVTTSINGSGTNGQVVVKTSALFTTPQLGAATFDSFTANLNTGNGNISANNISLGNILSAAGTVTGNLGLFTAGQVSANTATVTTLGNIGVIYANSTGGLTTDATNFNYDPTTELLTITNVGASGNVEAANVRVTTLSNTQVVYANATGGLVSDSVFTYDVATGNLGAANITATATVKGTDVTVTNLGNTEIVYANAAGGLQGTTDFVFDPTGSGNVTVTGNVAAGNFTTGGLVSATGNVTGANVFTGGQVSATGSVLSGANVSATGNVVGNTLNVGPVQLTSLADLTGLVSVTANGNITTTGNVTGNAMYSDHYFYANGTPIATESAGSNTQVQIANAANGFIASSAFTFDYAAGANLLTAGNITSSGALSAVGDVTANNASITNGVSANTATITTTASIGNVTITGSAIESNAGAINVNGAASDVDFVVSGTTANVLYVDAGTNTVSIGSNAQTTNAILALNSTNSFVVPVGNTLQRPSTGVVGMQRFNTTLGKLEIFDGLIWAPAGSTAFTVIADDQFTGDGVTTTFTLSSEQTTNSCIVSINGVVQVPGTAYSVTLTSLVFTEAPAVADYIDVREITTTTTVVSISNSSGNAVVGVSETSANVAVTGNLVVGAGGFLYGDGTYLTNVGGGNVTATKIVSGTSTVNIAGAGGQIYMAVAGANVINAQTGNIAITGNLNPSANATYDLGSATNQWNALYVKGTTIYIGDGTITSNASGITLTNNQGGSFTVGGDTAGAGNIEGGNVISTGVISTTGTVKGLLLSSTGNVTAAGNVNTVSINASGIVTAASFAGNGAALTGVQVSSANTAVTVTGNAQANITSVGILTSLSVSGNVTANNVSGTLTTATQAAITGVGTLTSLSVTGAITTGAGAGSSMVLDATSAGGRISTGAGDTINFYTGGIGATLLGGFTTSAGDFSAVGNITSGNTVTASRLALGTGTATVGNIVNGNGNAVGNIGSAANYFNTVFALATSAAYADLAEKYVADAEYAPGTVVSFGGEAEVTASTSDADRRIAGVVSTNPSYIMNGGLEGANVVTVALTGRVPCRVTGTVRKGDLMVSNGDGSARAEANPAVGSVIGKALENFDGATGTIEVVVGRV